MRECGSSRSRPSRMAVRPSSRSGRSSLTSWPRNGGSGATSFFVTVVVDTRSPELIFLGRSREKRRLGTDAPIGPWSFFQLVGCRRGELNPHAPQGALGPQPNGLRPAPYCLVRLKASTRVAPSSHPVLDGLVLRRLPLF